MQLTSRFDLVQESPVYSTGWNPAAHSHTEEHAVVCKPYLFRTRRYNWPLTPGHWGMEEGFEVKLKELVEGTHETRSRRNSGKTIYGKKERERKHRCRAKDRLCEAEMNGVTLFLFSYLSVAMATVPAIVDDQKIPVERTRQQRSNQIDEDGLERDGREELVLHSRPRPYVLSGATGKTAYHNEFSN